MISSAARAADNYKLDPVHSTVVFRIKHSNASYFWGRFNAPNGTFSLDEADPTKSTFAIDIQAANVDTGNAQRDTHLKSPDFFNARQYPAIKFKSTSVKKAADPNKLEVTGDVTMHGQTKPVTAIVELTGKGDMRGQQRAGVEATIDLKMSDFGMKQNPGLSDEVRIVAGVAGVKQ
jgi:polyisoprenoid-binding protein YceI